MATVQIRNVPDDVHRAFRRRAASAGMSLQEFLLAELTRTGRERTPAEVVADVEGRLAATQGEGFSDVPSAVLIRRDRDAR